MVVGFGIRFSHPHLASPIKGEEVLLRFRRPEESSAPFKGLPDASRSVGGGSLFQLLTSLAFARMPRAEARGGSAFAEGFVPTGMATGDRGVLSRRSCNEGGSPQGEAGLASAQFRLAFPQMPRAPVLRSSATAEGGEARGASL